MGERSVATFYFQLPWKNPPFLPNNVKVKFHQFSKIVQNTGIQQLHNNELMDDGK